MSAVFHADFDDVSDIVRTFKIKPEDLKGAEVIFASYDGDGYSGSAFVLFRRDRQLFEVNGSHCSCHGLEDQWDPEVATKKALLFRLDEGRLGQTYGFADLLRERLKSIREPRPAASS